MNKYELEKYITSKPNVIKRSIPGWKYVRYTVYDLAFATLEAKNDEIILTVFGRYEYYEKEYPNLVVPALNNEPLHFTSVLLSKGEVPDSVIKSIIDYSYKARLGTVVMPRMSGAGREDIHYYSLGNNDAEPSDYSEPESASELSAIEASAEFADLQRIRQEIADLSPEVELISIGDFNNMPYLFGEDDKILAEYAALKERLRELNNKKNKRQDKNDDKK